MSRWICQPDSESAGQRLAPFGRLPLSPSHPGASPLVGSIQPRWRGWLILAAAVSLVWTYYPTLKSYVREVRQRLPGRGPLRLKPWLATASRDRAPAAFYDLDFGRGGLWKLTGPWKTHPRPPAFSTAPWTEPSAPPTATTGTTTT